MKYTYLCLITLTIGLSVTGCSRNSDEKDASNNITAMPSSVASPTPVETKVPAPALSKKMEKKVAMPPQKIAPQPTKTTKMTPASSPANKKSIDRSDLAKASGCFACHSIEKKVIGPAWKDVAKHYKGDAGAKERLLEKVKKGGAGNWTSVTGGMPMPPYSPRVSDSDLELLVDFVLSLN